MSLQNRNKKNQLPDSPKDILDKISKEKDYQKIYFLGCSLNRLQASYLVSVLKNHKQQHKILINLFNSTLKRNPFDKGKGSMLYQLALSQMKEKGQQISE